MKNTNMKCDDCRYDYQSYHCKDCNSYNGNVDGLKSFCNYCNKNYGSDSCGNCVWYSGGLYD